MQLTVFLKNEQTNKQKTLTITISCPPTHPEENNLSALQETLYSILYCFHLVPVCNIHIDIQCMLQQRE